MLVNLIYNQNQIHKVIIYIDYYLLFPHRLETLSLLPIDSWYS